MGRRNDSSGYFDHTLLAVFQNFVSLGREYISEEQYNASPVAFCRTRAVTALHLAGRLSQLCDHRANALPDWLSSAPQHLYMDAPVTITILTPCPNSFSKVHRNIGSTLVNFLRLETLEGPKRDMLNFKNTSTQMSIIRTVQ